MQPLNSLYTLLGSVLMPAGMLVMYHMAGTTDIPALSAFAFGPELQFWLFLGFLLPLVKCQCGWYYLVARCPCAGPHRRFHDLGGVLLKWVDMLIRFSCHVPDARIFCALYFCVVHCSGDLHPGSAGTKRYEKAYCLFFVAHMGFVTIGIFTLTEQGIAGAMFQMISHGLVSAACFLSGWYMTACIRARSAPAAG